MVLRSMGLRVLATLVLLNLVHCAGTARDDDAAGSQTSPPPSSPDETMQKALCPEPVTLDRNGEPRNAAGDIRYCWPDEAFCHCDADNDCYARAGYVPCTPVSADAGADARDATPVDVVRDTGATTDAGACPPEPTTLDSNGEPRNAAGDIRYCWPWEAFCHCDADNDCYARAGYVPCSATADAGRDTGVDTGTDAGRDASADAGACPPEPTTPDANGEPRNAAGRIRYCWPWEAFCHCDADNDCYARAGYVPCSGVADAGTDAGRDTGVDTGTDAARDASADAGACPPEPTTLDSNGEPRNAAGRIRYCWPWEAFCHCDADNDCYARAGYVPCSAPSDAGTDAGGSQDSGSSTGRVTSVSETTSPAQGIVNESVTIRASSTGSSAPRYHYFAVTPSGQYTEPCGGYTAATSCTFTPTVAGMWQIAVSARDASSSAQYEATTNEQPYSVIAVSAVIAVDATRDLGAVNRDVFGANFEYIGDDNTSIEPFVTGVPLLRFPGGDDQSLFEWDSTDHGTCARPQWTWPDFASLATRTNSGLVIETNLVRSTPTNSAAWVHDALARGFRVAWVDIGDEPWGDWDAGYRTPEEYATDVREYAQAIRATAPGTRIVLEVGTSNDDAWNRIAVHNAADVIDAIDYHYYPNHQSSPDPMQVAAGADGVAAQISRLRTMLAQEAPARAAQIQILVGEYDGAGDGSRYPPVPFGQSFAVWNMSDALFYGAVIGEMLDAGVAASMYYEIQGYRYGGTGGNACLPTDYSLHRPKELAARLWREHFGDRRIVVTPQRVPTFVSNGPTQWDGFAGTAPLVRAYASLSNDGRALTLMVVNRGATGDLPVEFQLNGFVPASTATLWRVAGNSITATNENVGGPTDAVHIDTLSIPAQGPSFVFTAAAHSVNAIRLTR